jgi:hypothetical protein
MTRTQLFLVALAVTAGVLSIERESYAFNHVGNVVPVTLSNQFFTTTVYQPAGDWVTIQTANLTAGGDTVLHVQDAGDPNGHFIAGNDDFNGQLSSYVYVPAAGVARTLKVIVRSYAAASAGTCDVYINAATAGWTFFYTQGFGLS